MRFAGLWLLATVAGFLLAALLETQLLFPLQLKLSSLLLQAQVPLVTQRSASLIPRGAAALLSTLLGCVFQAGLLQVRLRLGLAWLVATGASSLAFQPLFASLVIVEPATKPLYDQAVTSLLFNNLVPSVLTAIAGWVVVRRQRHAAVWLLVIPIATVLAALIQLPIAIALSSGPFVFSEVAQSLARGLIFGVLGGAAMTWILGTGEDSHWPESAPA